MIPEGEATRQLRAVVPEEHFAAATRSLFVGGGLFLAGLFLIVAGMLLLFRTEFDKWLLVPLAVGFVLCVLGAHVASSKRVGAAIRDIGALIPLLRKSSQ